VGRDLRSGHVEFDAGRDDRLLGNNLVALRPTIWVL
jgi:hypothetical protein